MTMLISVPLAAMCVCLVGVLLSAFALGATGRKVHPLDYLSAGVFWVCLVTAVLSGGFAAVVKLTLVFSGNT